MARACLARWSEEWKEKRTKEMETFNGKREVNINEGETASSFSQSRVSHGPEKAQRLAQEAQKEFGGMQGGKKTTDGRKVAFEEPESPGMRLDRSKGEIDGREGISEIDKILNQAEDDLDLGNLDKFDRMVSYTLEDLSKAKSR